MYSKGGETKPYRERKGFVKEAAFKQGLKNG